MSIAAPPLRFLAVVVGGWVCFRAAVLLPDLWTEVGSASPLAPAPRPRGEARVRATPFEAASPAPMQLGLAAEVWSGERLFSTGTRELADSRASLAVTFDPTSAEPRKADATAEARLGRVTQSHAPASLPPVPPPRAIIPAAGANRWSASAWLFARKEGGTALAPGGTLGGSQAGARILYRMNADPARPLALSAKFYAPLERSSAAEAAIGMDWRPVRTIPVQILAERRQALGGSGRSAFALTLHGGASERLARKIRLDAYGQAGMVGLKSRDLFAEGALRVSAAAGPIDVGAGAWAAAQPGAARIDIGPQASIPFRAGGANLRLYAEWRFRIAGDAEPGSGPALAIGADF